MKNPITIILLLFSMCCAAQLSKTVYRFTNSDSTLIGYKDISGNVKIPLRFSHSFTRARKIEHIAAFSERVDGKMRTGYVTNTGKIVARDSLYTLDATPECESEGFILFSNNKTRLVGLLNEKGDVALPAEYNAMTRVRNGVIMSLKGATRVRNGNDEYDTFEGGKDVLMDVNGNVLIEDFIPYELLNMYSMKVHSAPEKDTIWKSYKGVNGKYYCFINYHKEFERWFNTEFLKKNTKQAFLSYSMQGITHWIPDMGWIYETKRNFANANWEDIARMYTVDTKVYKPSYFSEGLNQFIYEQPEFLQYYDNCGHSSWEQYPVMQVIYQDKEYKRYCSFTFLRTDKGYRLIEVGLPKQG